MERGRVKGQAGGPGVLGWGGGGGGVGTSRENEKIYMEEGTQENLRQGKIFCNPRGVGKTACRRAVLRTKGKIIHARKIQGKITEAGEKGKV